MSCPATRSSSYPLSRPRACFLCGIQLGTEAVVLKFSERGALLYTRCFTAWLEVVITARQKPWPNGVQSAQECLTRRSKRTRRRSLTGTRPTPSRSRSHRAIAERNTVSTGRWERRPWRYPESDIEAGELPRFMPSAF